MRARKTAPGLARGRIAFAQQTAAPIARRDAESAASDGIIVAPRPASSLEDIKLRKVGSGDAPRLREFFLGSVTDAVLRALKVPALMSH
jgi:nucleotide-binding universal stress UspA family protein